MTSVPALAALAALAAAPLAIAEPFLPRVPPAGFDGPLHLTPVAADFTGDGRLEWYGGGRKISHFPHSTTLTTLPPVSFSGCPGCAEDAHDFAVFDVDGDGHPDIARLLLWPGVVNTITLQVYLNDGSGGFTLGSRVDWSEAPSFDYGGIILQMAAADFDRDGRTDIAVMTTFHYTDRSQSKPVERGKLVLRWNTAGSFQQAQTVQSLHFSDQSTLRAADLDRDGFPELFVTHISEYYQASDGKWVFTPHHRVFRNDREGWFTVETKPGMRFTPTFVDADRDGWPDLVFHDAGQHHGLSWQRNDRAGGLSASMILEDGFTGASGPPHAFADLDEDGKSDLVTAEGTSAGQSHRLMLRKALGAGFAAPTLIATLPANIVRIAAADIDSDGDIDLLLRLADGSTRLLHNLAPRLFPRAVASAGIQLPGASRLHAADIDRDGNLDLLALVPDASRLYLYHGQGTGAFATPAWRATHGGGAPADFVIDDFDSDGRPDIAYAVPSSGAVRWVRQNAGVFTGWNDAEIGTYAGASMLRSGRLVAGRLSPDLLVGSSTTGGVRWLTNPKQATSWGASTVLQPQPLPLRSILATPQPGFGDSPFVLGSDGIGIQLAGYRNVLGWVKVVELLMLEDAPQPGVMIQADIDGSPGSEIVLVDGIGRLAWWRPSSSVGLVTGVIDDAPPGTLRALAAVDFNRDGRTDIVAGTSQGIYLYAREHGNETWTRRDLVAGATDVLSITVGDFNRDGLTDVAYVDGQSGRIMRVENTSTIVQRTSALGHGQVTVAPGQAGTGFTIHLRNPGRPQYDAAIALTRSRVLFRKAVATANGWEPGPAMTKAEVQQVLQNVSIVANNQLVAIATPNAVAADGGLTIELNALGSVVQIHGQQTQAFDFRVALRADAASASVSVSRFFIQHDPASNAGGARVLHAGAPVGKYGTFDATAGALIDILKPSTPPEAIFADGFEK